MALFTVLTRFWPSSRSVHRSTCLRPFSFEFSYLRGIAQVDHYLHEVQKHEVNVCAVCWEHCPVILDSKRGALDSWNMQQESGCLDFALPCQERLDMLLLHLRELIGPCSCYLYLETKST